ncbi:MAG: CapA family protein, partial [Acidobacteriota bacterium]
FLKTTAVAAGAAALGRSAAATATPPMTVAAVGDLIPNRRFSERREQGFLDIVEILRTADCAWGNCETVLADPDRVYPSYKEGDPYTLCEPWGADELAFLGLDCVGTANNHIVDWGLEGLFSTLEHLDRVGLAHAGSGRDLAHAAAPGYRDTSGGRVAQVNCASTFRDYFAAGESNTFVRGRPGLNPIHLDSMLRAPAEVVEWFRGAFPRIIELQGAAFFQDLIDDFMAKLPPGSVPFDRTLITTGDEVDLIGVAQQPDLDRIYASIAVARRNARVVMATLHAHEARSSLDLNAPFIEPFARGAIDAGADCFFAAGPHVLRGIELHEGRPIFYGLSNFVFQYANNPRVPASAWQRMGFPADSVDPSLYSGKIPYNDHPQFWETIVPVITYEGGDVTGDEALVSIERPRITDIVLYPVTLGFGEPIWRRGTPSLAHGDAAREILDKVVRLSEPYGTEIDIDEDVGRIVLPG